MIHFLTMLLLKEMLRERKVGSSLMKLFSLASDVLHNIIAGVQAFTK